jgi:hypothetical protein
LPVVPLPDARFGPEEVPPDDSLPDDCSVDLAEVGSLLDDCSVQADSVQADSVQAVRLADCLALAGLLQDDCSVQGDSVPAAPRDDWLPVDCSALADLLPDGCSASAGSLPVDCLAPAGSLPVDCSALTDLLPDGCSASAGWARGDLRAVPPADCLARVDLPRDDYSEPGQADLDGSLPADYSAQVDCRVAAEPAAGLAAHCFLPAAGSQLAPQEWLASPEAPS